MENAPRWEVCHRVLKAAIVLGLADTSSSSKVPAVCPSQAQLPPWMRFLFIQLEFLPFFFGGSSSLKLESSLVSLSSRHTLLAPELANCEAMALMDCLSKSIQLFLVVSYPYFLPWHPGMCPCFSLLSLLSTSEFGVLCLCIVSVFDGHISFRMIFIFLLGTNFRNL